MSLSSLIVLRQLATMRQVEEALARQVIYGGDLVTNLLEVVLVDETLLIDLLATSLHLPPAPAGELPRPSDSASSFVTAELASQTVCVPIEARDRALVLAVAEPLATEVREKIATSTGMHIEERAAPAVRIWQSIAKIYGVRLERRMQRLVGRLAGEEWVGATPLAPPISSQMPATAPPRRNTPRASVAPRRPSAALPVAAHATVAGAASMKPAPRRHSTLKTFPTDRPPPTVARPSPILVDEAKPAPEPAPEPAAAPELVQRAPTAPLRPGQRHRGPLLFEDAEAEAEEASDRDGLLGLAFDFARQFFEYTALFLVHGDIAEGRDGFGSGATRERVLGIGVPLDLPSLLSRAREARIAIVATPPPDGLDAVLLADLQRPRNTEMAVVPIVVRTRAVALLVGDCGEAGIDRTALRQITELCGIVSRAFERIIVRRKLEGFVAGGLGGAAGRVEAVMVSSKRAGPAAPDPAAVTPQARPVAEVASLATRTRSSAPPAVNISTLRQISGPPIPREEPEEDSRPTLQDVVAPAAPQARKALVSSPPPEGDIVTFIERLFAAGADLQAEAALARLPDRLLRQLMGRFPGPVTLPRSQVAGMTPPIQASECGPVLWVVARARKRAVPYLLEWLADSDADKRGWAAHLLCELPSLEALPGLLARRDDVDPTVRLQAGHAMAAMNKTFGKAVVDALTRFGPDATPEQRADALRSMGEAGEPATVPDLIRGLDDDEDRVSVVAHEALVRITRQDFGRDARPWLEWWDQNAARHRIEWLIDALVHKAPEIRQAAGEELRSQSRQYFGFASDLPVRERERAQQRYRDWWITEGRSRHVRA
jgi:hypothetical protein